MTTTTHASGSVRPARLSDRQALGSLSRQVHAARDGHRRSLGVPAPATQAGIELSALIPSWLPMRPPSVHLVAEADGRLVGSCRAIEEPHRADWMIIELDAEDGPLAAEVRWTLLRALLDAGARRNVARYHVACADVRDNLELFGQAGFVAYADEEILYRPGVVEDGPGADLPAVRPTTAADAWHLFDLWTHTTPPAVARMEDYAATDWEDVAHQAVVPRTSLNPILHFSAVHGWLAEAEQRAVGFAQYGACREGPHYVRFLVRDGTDGAGFLAAVLAGLPRRARAAGLLAPVRTYEGGGLAAAGEAGFTAVGQVRILVREARSRVRQPALVPAVN